MRNFDSVSSRLLGLCTALTLGACGGPAGEESAVGPMLLSSTAKALDTEQAPPLAQAPANMKVEVIDLRVRSEPEGTHPSLVASSYSASNTDNARVNSTDMFFSLLTGHTVTFGTCGVNGASGSGDTYLRLYDPFGIQRAFNDNSCGLLSNLTYVSPANATFRLRAGCAGNTFCSGTVGYSVNGTLFSYSVSNTSSATVNSYDVGLQIVAGQLLTLGTCGVNGASGTGDTYLRLFDPNGVQVASSDDAGGCGLLSNFTYPVQTAGTYLLRAGCYGNTACSGTVSFLSQ
jgi:hypothetical protein